MSSNDNHFDNIFTENKLTEGINNALTKNYKNVKDFMRYICVFVKYSLPSDEIYSKIIDDKTEVIFITCINMPIRGSITTLTVENLYMNNNIVPVSTYSRSFIIGISKNINYATDSYCTNLETVFTNDNNITKNNVSYLVSRVTKSKNFTSCFHIVVALGATMNNRGRLQYRMISLRGHKTLFHPNCNNMYSLIMPVYILPLEVALFGHRYTYFTQNTIDLAMNQLVSAFNLRYKGTKGRDISKPVSELLDFKFHKCLENAFAKMLTKASNGIRNNNEIFRFMLRVVPILNNNHVYVHLYMNILQNCEIDGNDYGSLCTFPLLNSQNDFMRKFSREIAFMTFKNQIINSLVKYLDCSNEERINYKLTWNCGMILGFKGMLYSCNLTDDNFDINEYSFDLLGSSSGMEFVFDIDDTIMGSRNVMESLKKFNNDLLQLYMQLDFSSTKADIKAEFNNVNINVNDEEIVSNIYGFVESIEKNYEGIIVGCVNCLRELRNDLQGEDEFKAFAINAGLPEPCIKELPNLCKNNYSMISVRKSIIEWLLIRLNASIRNYTERNFLLAYLLRHAVTEIDFNTILDSMDDSNKSKWLLSGCALIDFIGCCGFNLMNVNPSIWITKFRHPFAKVLEAYLYYCNDKKASIAMTVVQSYKDRSKKVKIAYEQLVLLLYRTGIDIPTIGEISMLACCNSSLIVYSFSSNGAEQTLGPRQASQGVSIVINGALQHVKSRASLQQSRST